ncbi:MULTISPECIES: diaminopimelate decarboxylase [unclassified Streptomyces]|uniref:diaminopimelate decarboxylase n=1 Tax=unclassified Streptomyces TaxID=2593676 RepID=UPI0035E2C66C
MDSFTYENGSLRCEGVDLQDVAAEYGTPTYVYSRSTLATHLADLSAAFADLDPLVCYAVKTCSNLHLLSELASGGAGADVVSGGELHRAIAAGIPPERIVFAGVGKSQEELEEAVAHNIGCINVESESELELLARVVAKAGRPQNVAVRVNPDVEGHNTPEKTTTGTRGSKFGVDLERVADIFARAAELPHLRLTGLHVHLGSPIHSPEPYVRALTRILALEAELRAAGHTVELINMGGGFAAAYETGSAPGWKDYAEAIVPVLRPFVEAGGRVVMEPGRSIAANAGILLTRVRYLKQAGDRTVAIVDAGMNNLIRAAFYDAFHFMWPVRPADGVIPPARTESLRLDGSVTYDVAGPICESSDYLARDRALPALREGDLIAVFGAGAYGMTMASQYNSSLRPAEVLVEGFDSRLIRRRDTYEDLVAAELGLPGSRI